MSRLGMVVGFDREELELFSISNLCWIDECGVCSIRTSICWLHLCSYRACGDFGEVLGEVVVFVISRDMGLVLLEIHHSIFSGFSGTNNARLGCKGRFRIPGFLGYGFGVHGLLDWCGVLVFYVCTWAV